MLGSLIGAGASIIGGLLGAKQADKQAALQKEFAQHGISWKAADAERAGISKLYAIGAPSVSYSPVSTGSLGAGIADAGSKLGAAIDSQNGPLGTTTQKQTGLAAQLLATQIEGAKLDNDIKRASLASKVAVATQPGAGGIVDRDVTQGPSGVSLKKEIAPSSGDPLTPQTTFGATGEVDLYKTRYGLSPQIPQNLQEAFESDALGRWQWNLRNRVMPYLSDNYMAVQGRGTGGYYTFDPLMGEYVYVPWGGSKSGPTASHRWEYLMNRLRR